MTKDSNFGEKAARHLLEGNWSAYREIHEVQGVVKSADGFDSAGYDQMIQAMTQFYLGDQLFCFSDDYFRDTWELVQRNPNSSYSYIPKDEVMACRLYFGNLTNLCALGAQANWREKLLQVL